MKDAEQYEQVQKKIEELKLKEYKLVTKHMPKFERGIAEAALEREKEVWQDISQALEKHKIMPSVKIRLVTDNQPSEDPSRPLLACAGVGVDISYIVQPVDTTGKSGKLPQEVYEQIGKIRKDISALMKELEDNEGE